MNVHWRLALIALTALALAGLATWLAWRTRAQARTDRANTEARDADFRSALREVHKLAQKVDRDLDTITAAWVARFGHDPFAPVDPDASQTLTADAAGQFHPVGQPQDSPARTEVPPRPPTPYPRTQAIAAVRPQPNPADIPTEAATEIRQGGAHRPARDR